MDLNTMLRAFRAMSGEQTAQQKQGVMTDVGPSNARAYTAILAGQGEPEGPPKKTAPKYTNIVPPPPASTLPGTGTVSAPGPYGESLLVGAGVGPAEHPPQATQSQTERGAYPTWLDDYENDELRFLVNQLHGKAPGQRGAVPARTKRPRLLEMAAAALGQGAKRPRSQSAPLPPSPPTFTTSEVATSGVVDFPAYGSILAASQSPTDLPQPPLGLAGIAGRLGSDQAVSSAAAETWSNSNVAAADPAPGPCSIAATGTSVVAAATERLRGDLPHAEFPPPPLPPHLTSQADTGATTGPGGSSYATRPTTSGVSFATPPMTGPQSAPQIAAAGSSPRAYPAITASAPPPVQSQVATPGQPLPMPEKPILAQAVNEEPTKLTEAIKRLTDAVEASNEKERTVSQDVAGLSLGERYQRLEKSGNLVSEDETKSATLKDIVTPRDIVQESERREQRQRDLRARQRQSAVGEARDDLARNVGQRVTGFVTQFAGPKVGERVGQMTQRIAGVLASRGVASATGTAAGSSGAAAATAGLGGVAARLGAVAIANPVAGIAVAAIAATAALTRLPGAADRLGTSLVEAQRNFAKYNAKMAAAYARLDYQTRLLDIQHAGATSGSSSLLTEQLRGLKADTQGMRDFAATIKNTWTAGFVAIARAAVNAGKLIPMIQEIAWVAKKFEEWFGNNNTGNIAIVEHMQRMATYSPYTSRPINKRPGEGNSNNQGNNPNNQGKPGGP